VTLRIVEKASLTDVGRQRQGNEDSYFEHSPLFAVADGMGGARAGEVASRIAVEMLASEQPDGSPEEQLAAVARAANRRIYEMAQSDSDLAGMGTTLTAALVNGREVVVGHVGDSRLYRLRDDALERLTHDHSLVEEFVRQGKLTPEEAEVHPQRSIITRALGPEPDVEVETFTFPARGGDVYLLCSDGLTGMVAEDAVADVLRRSGSLEDAARSLIAAANANGGKDNITTVLFRLEGDGEAGEDPDTLAGQEETVVSPQTVRAAVAEADEHDARAAEPDAAADAHTFTLPADEAERARARQAAPAPASRPPPPPTPPRRRGGGARRLAVPLLAAVALAAVVVGLYAASRQVWFVGTDDRGQVALYRGVPYDLPLGVELYSEEYVSGVPATLLEPRQRGRLSDHKWRSKDDAVDLVREYERTHTRQ
jgi:PPM family protein phosphatase